MTRLRLLACLTAIFGLLLAGFPAEAATRGHVFVLMVWDGLRPDSVTPADTPTLAALEEAGTDFSHHHSVFPTLTMVNAAAMATGAPPGANGIFGDGMYLAPALPKSTPTDLASLAKSPLNLENTALLSRLDGPGAFGGSLLELTTVAHEVVAQHGYVAIIGKAGPTYLFDHPGEPGASSSRDLLFVTGDDATAPPIELAHPATIGTRDAWYTRVAIERALPAARKAARAGHPALIVLWQQNPDLTQHMAGLGTAPALNALRGCDSNLHRLRSAIARDGLERETDLMVVSDHGFATIKVELSLRKMLVAAGLKHAADSDDIIVAADGGSDLVYLSRASFASREARRAMLARIVDFVAAQDWGGPIFTEAGPPAGTTQQDHNLGWIPGTFSQSLIGLQDAERSPDLVVSFRELPDVSNQDFTGPSKPAFTLGMDGQSAVPNHSMALVREVPGVVYADNGGSGFTTGMGMHGAAGERELHNFCATEGPDFRRHFDDPSPSGNVDIAPTIRTVLELPPMPASTGRVLDEALATAKRDSAQAQESTATAYLVLQGSQIATQLKFSSYAGHDYLDASSVTRNPIGGPQ